MLTHEQRASAQPRTMKSRKRNGRKDVEDRLDKLMAEIALLKENVMRDVEYVKATVRSDISQLQNDLLYLKTNQHKIEEKITTLENIINNLTKEMRQKW